MLVLETQTPDPQVYEAFSDFVRDKVFPKGQKKPVPVPRGFSVTHPKKREKLPFGTVDYQVNRFPMMTVAVSLGELSMSTSYRPLKIGDVVGVVAVSKILGADGKEIPDQQGVEYGAMVPEPRIVGMGEFDELVNLINSAGAEQPLVPTP